MADQQRGQPLDPFRDGPWAPAPGERAFDEAPHACPDCGSEYARPVSYIFSLSVARSFLVPWMWNLYQCEECGEKFSVPGPRLRRFLIVCVPLAIFVVPILVAILIGAITQ